MFVNPADIAAKMKLDPPSIVLVYRYWMLKRRVTLCSLNSSTVTLTTRLLVCEPRCVCQCCV
jgi:hypothetical protein